MDEHPPPVFLRVRAFHQFFIDHPVDQTDGAVMTELQTLSQFADADTVASGKSLDRQQRLVLLRPQADRLRRLFAEMKKPPERIAKCRERFILRFVKFFRFRHCCKSNTDSARTATLC